MCNNFYYFKGCNFMCQKEFEESPKPLGFSSREATKLLFGELLHCLFFSFLLFCLVPFFPRLDSYWNPVIERSTNPIILNVKAQWYKATKSNFFQVQDV